jgi:acyl-CoA synthetase (AMP-forming)/AMP-acid ligase II
MNTTDYLLQYAQDDQIAIITKEKSYTYKELSQAIDLLEACLLEHGISSGDRVGILGNNSIFWIASYLSVLKIGAVAVPFATTLTPDEISRNENFVHCKVLLAERRQHRRAATAFRPDLPVLLDDLLEQPPSGVVRVEGKPITEFDLDRDAALMFTSGTTQRPRAVRVTHRNIQANTNSIIEYLALSSSERIMVILPFYYCFGTSLLHTHLRVGGTVVLSNTFTYPETTLDMMEAAQCTGFAGVPSTYQILLRNSSFPRRELPSLRKIQQAGGKLQTVLIRELVNSKPHAQLYVMYGQTEATARLSYLPPELLPSKLGSIGKGIPGVTLRVLNEEGQPVKPGETGEIIATGDNISPGYLEDPDASAEKFIHGSLYTGDLATVDEDGFIFVVDRKSDFIKSLGHRISSQEVESTIIEIPSVVAAAVIGVPDLVLGEAIWAFVVPASNSQVTADEIITHCREKLAKHMVPGEVVFIKSLPMNAHGKIVKAELKKLAAERLSQNQEAV